MLMVTLIVTLGMTPDPVRKTIEDYMAKGPLTCYFIVSEETEKIAAQLRAEYGEVEAKVFVVEDPEDIDSCLKTSYSAVREAMKKGGEIVIDYTGGTKTMSAALVFAALEVLPKVTLRYIGGFRRDETGRVITGYERVTERKGAVYAILIEAGEEYETFNIVRAYQLLKSVADTTKSEYYRALASFVEALARRDYLDYPGALDVAQRYKRKYEVYADPMIFSDEVVKFFRRARENLQVLFRITSVLKKLRSLKNMKEPGEAAKIVREVAEREDLREGLEYLVADLILNVERRLKREENLRACLLTYRLYELLVQYVLMIKYGVSPTNTDWESVDEELRGKLVERWKELPQHLDLKRGLEMLEALGDPLPGFFDEEVLRNLQYERNHSLIEHGFASVDKEVVEKALGDLRRAAEEVIPGIEEKIEECKFPRLSEAVLLAQRR